MVTIIAMILTIASTTGITINTKATKTGTGCPKLSVSHGIKPHQ